MSQIGYRRANELKGSGYGLHYLEDRLFLGRISLDLFQWKVLSLNLARLTASGDGGLGLFSLGLSSHSIIGDFEVCLYQGC